MTVYVLENGCYSDTRIVGIYSTRELAEMVARIFTDDPNITEWDIDEMAADIRDGCVPFFVRLDRESGDTLDVYEDAGYVANAGVMGEDVKKNLYTRCWAKSRDHAVKIASERRRMFLAQVTS